MKLRSRPKVIVGMSGGVDSSVAAALLKKRGFDVVGVFMKNWSDDFKNYGCTWAEDAEDARKVAHLLKIPFYVWNFEKQYYEKVVEHFLSEYSKGRTPNPDILCNSEIKFKLFLDKALLLGADYVATGHYARVQSPADSKDSYKFLKAIDPSKDQSYFLYTLKQHQLSKILFPLGDYKKSQVRELAKKLNLPNANKKDSQGICFIGKINVREFLKEKLPAVAGEIVTASGQIMGRHDGLNYYTIGQREGMNIGGHGPYYVVAKNSALNQLVVTNDQKDIKLWRKEFILDQLSVVDKPIDTNRKYGVSIRYHHPETKATITPFTTNKYRIVFDEPQRAITVGQHAVIYDNDLVVGGGVIDQVK